MIIVKKDGTEIDVESYGVKRLFHFIPSNGIEHKTVSIDGIGPVTLSSTLTNRTIRVEFGYRTSDIFDSYLLRESINNLFTTEEYFYIIFKREDYKRYKVRLANQFEITPSKKLGKFVVEFITISRYAESVSYNTDLKEWDIDKYAWNGMINWDNNFQYSFKSNNFNVNNLGNVKIDPRENELEITIKGVFSEYINVTNRTTGDVYIYNESLDSNDELKIIGIQTFKNEISSFSKTNKKLITLNPKNNSFVVTGGTIENISFKFRNLFK